MLQMLWPVLLIAFSNAFYHGISKSIPGKSNALFTLVFTYSAAAVTSMILFLADRTRSSVSAEFSKISPYSLLLGIVVVGLEFGSIYIYRTGWKISQGSLVAHVLSSIVLLFVGLLLYKESISIRQIIGTVVCLAGIILITS